MAPMQVGPAPGLLWASIAYRFGAILIDAGVMFVALIAAAIIAEAFGVRHYLDRDVYSAGASVTYFLYFAFLLAYHPTCWWAFQGTLGQRALGMRVLRARDGHSLGVGETAIRYLLFAICTVTIIPGVIAAAVASDSLEKRTWWDDAAGSVVVKQL
jgi:uncharacterized RDD family membrane protein YckC